MAVENIKNRFFEIQSTKYTSIEDKKRDLMTLDNITTNAILFLKPRILKGDAPRFMKWEYSDLISYYQYINNELTNLGGA